MTRDPEKKRAIWRRYYWKHRTVMCARMRESYHRNRKRHLAHTKAVRVRQVRYLKGLRARTPCSDCRRRYPWFVMEFDHVRGIKSACVASLTGSMKRLKEEIAKCDIVCANCHCRRTHRRRRETITKTLHPKRKP